MGADDDLLISATPDLLDDWCGPGVLVTPSKRERVTIDGEDGGVYLLNGLWVDYNTSYLPVLFAEDMTPLGDLHLDLSRAEVRDRVARCLLVGAELPTAPAWGWHPNRWVLIDDSGVLSREFWPKPPIRSDAGDWTVPSLAGLDPNDDTRLPDGSRRVDAVALGRVWREVAGG